MESGWFDREAIDQERFDADMEMAELQAEGNRRYRRRLKSDKLYAEGRLSEAAALCPHGGGYPLNSLAARNESDPRAGQVGVRCYDCGSVLSAWPYEGPVTILHPCDWRKAR